MIAVERTALRARLARLAEALGEDTGDGVAPAAAALVSAPAAPARVLVAGRLKAGKSTLVNALAGRRVAATDEAECTRIVTEYRYAPVDRAELHLLDGRTLVVTAPGESPLPQDLPVEPEAIDRAVVYVHEAPLRELVLIDTPGLGTPDGAREAATRRGVADRSIDVLLYAFREIEMADDVEFLRSASVGVARPVGVLTHADTFGGGPWDGEDPVPLATSFAGRIAERRPELGAVVAVAGGLAEVVAIGGLTEQDARTLSALVGLDAEDLRDGFDLPPGITTDAVAGLVERLGPYAVARGRRPARRGAASLARWARTAGGADALALALVARRNGAVLLGRTSAAFHLLTEAVQASPRRASLVPLLAEAREDVALQPLRTFAAVGALHRADAASPLLSELESLIDADGDAEALGLPPGADPGAIARAAARMATAAHAGGLSGVGGAERGAALALERAYRRIGSRASSGSGSVGTPRPHRASNR